MRLDIAADELEHKQLKEEALMLKLKNRDVELSNATMQLENDSLEAHNKNLQLSEYQSKMQAQQEKEHAHHVLLVAAGAIALLFIGFLCFDLYRHGWRPADCKRPIINWRMPTAGWRRRPPPRSASRANCALPATFRCRWCHRPSPIEVTSISMD